MIRATRIQVIEHFPIIQDRKVLNAKTRSSRSPRNLRGAEHPVKPDDPGCSEMPWNVNGTSWQDAG